jgi:hypothetical protein
MTCLPKRGLDERSARRPAEKRKALENCLSHDLHHSRARRSLAILDGKLKADEMVNPDRLPAAPDGCAARMPTASCAPSAADAWPSRPTAVHSSVIIARASMRLAGSEERRRKGFHRCDGNHEGTWQTLQEQAFHCNGCGAEFILPPRQISANCAYCDSPHVVSLEHSKDLLAPDAIIPHAFDQKRAVQLLVDWVEKEGITPEKQVDPPRGLYLPLWTFDIGGTLDYTGEVVEYEEQTFSSKRQRKVVRINDKYPVLVDDLPLPASRKLSAVFSKLIPTFDLKSLQPYDARFLASWPAEIYDVPMADASLDARSQAYRQLKRDLPARLGGVNIVHISSAGIMVSSFKLNLLPVWMTEIPFDGREHLLLINGQSGIVASDLPESLGLLSGFKELSRNKS